MNGYTQANTKKQVALKMKAPMNGKNSGAGKGMKYPENGRPNGNKKGMKYSENGKNTGSGGGMKASQSDKKGNFSTNYTQNGTC